MNDETTPQPTPSQRATVEDLQAKYGHRWEIVTDLAVGVAAWRKTYLPTTSLTGALLNVLHASNLDALGARLAEQENESCQ
ncbi:hypothetical protein [Nonomuraea sp. NPDC050783]|uniref:hypothetical protein n=1 Tax=Nonomuraea sp. NPDC050783 TaxID=3154634 RepID=UPI003465DAE6